MSRRRLHVALSPCGCTSPWPPDLRTTRPARARGRDQAERAELDGTPRPEPQRNRSTDERRRPA